jgi:hypothetical protein
MPEPRTPQVVVSIASPAAGATVTDSFTAYGTVSPSNASMTAGCQPVNGGNVIWGTAVAPPQGYDWAFSFNLAPGTEYNLGVEGSAPNYLTGGQQEDITSQ